jgi:hypothetical protein
MKAMKHSVNDIGLREIRRQLEALSKSARRAIDSSAAVDAYACDLEDRLDESGVGEVELPLHDRVRPDQFLIRVSREGWDLVEVEVGE